jgi:acetyl-CoA carboxylase biotin carboxyl carrier protein
VPPEEGSRIPSPFDIRTIKELVALMSRHDLSEIDLREGNLRIRLRRGPQGTVTMSPVLPVAAPLAGTTAPMSTPPSPASGVPAEEQAKPAKNLATIKSPTPGTFYASPSPDAEVFVKVGSKVVPTTVVCLIEAMKIFNEITADCTGVVTEVCVENQQPVEFGQVLFKVDPTG